MPGYHEVKVKDVNLKRLGIILALAHDSDIKNFESMLLLNGLGPRTLQSLVLVSEVIYGTASWFADPARFSFAHGGKDGHPFPVPLKIYDETLNFLDQTIQNAKIGIYDKKRALKSLVKAASRIEENFIPDDNINQVIQKERDDYKNGGRTVNGFSQPSTKIKEQPSGQLSLF